MEDTYLKRIVDVELKEYLEFSGAVLIEGAKWCGKTSTAEEVAISTLYMQDRDKSSTYIEKANTKPSSLLEGDVPRLIDEWQIAPVLWDAVRFSVDKRKGKSGQFILTGSAVPKDDGMRHSGTGRIARLLMRPMSLFESLESNGTVSLGNLFDGVDMPYVVSELSHEKLAFALVRGGWPASIGLKENIALRIAREYIKSVINTDISKVDGVKKNPANVRKLLKSLSRNISTTATITTISKDVMGENRTISERTVVSYIAVLKRIFVIEELPAWSPSLRSKTAIRSSSKRYFVDPSIATASMNISPDKLLNDYNIFGLLFESLCIRDLRVYAQSIDGEVFYYRDKQGLEIDAIVELYDGRWGAIEVKLGSTTGIDEAVKNLKKFRDNIDTNRTPAPSFLMVLTATEQSYEKDGVLIVPIGCLKN